MSPHLKGMLLDVEITEIQCAKPRQSNYQIISEGLEFLDAAFQAGLPFL